MGSSNPKEMKKDSGFYPELENTIAFNSCFPESPKIFTKSAKQIRTFKFSKIFCKILQDFLLLLEFSKGNSKEHDRTLENSRSNLFSNFLCNV